MILKSEIIKVRDRGDIALPIEMRRMLNINGGDLIKLELQDTSNIILHKLIPHKASNNLNKNNNGCKDSSPNRGNNRDGDEEESKAIANKKTHRKNVIKNENKENDRNPKSGGGSTTAPSA